MNARWSWIRIGGLVLLLIPLGTSAAPAQDRSAGLGQGQAQVRSSVPKAATVEVPAEVADLYCQANDALRVGDWPRAARLYSGVLEKAPTLKPVRVRYGIALVREVAAQVGTRPVDAIFLTHGAELAVFERGRTTSCSVGSRTALLVSRRLMPIASRPALSARRPSRKG
jgi:hypothetical protein